MTEQKPPWPAELALDFARFHIEEGEFNGLYLVGTDQIGVVPCVEDPLTTGAMIGMIVLAGQMPTPSWIIFVADTYELTSRIPEGVAPDDIPVPDNLAEAFKAGDDRITESAAVICICPDGPTYHATQPYVRDGDEIDWGEIDVHTDLSTIEGPVTDVMRKVLMSPSGAVPEAADRLTMLYQDMT